MEGQPMSGWWVRGKGKEEEKKKKAQGNGKKHRIGGQKMKM